MSLKTAPAEQMVKPSEAARLLGVHENTIRNWIRDDAIPYVKTPGGHYLLPWSLLAQTLRGTYDLTAPLPEQPTDEEEAAEQLRR